VPRLLIGFIRTSQAISTYLFFCPDRSPSPSIIESPLSLKFSDVDAFPSKASSATLPDSPAMRVTNPTKSKETERILPPPHIPPSVVFLPFHGLLSEIIPASGNEGPSISFVVKQLPPPRPSLFPPPFPLVVRIYALQAFRFRYLFCLHNCFFLRALFGIGSCPLSILFPISSFSGALPSLPSFLLRVPPASCCPFPPIAAKAHARKSQLFSSLDEFLSLPPFGEFLSFPDLIRLLASFLIGRRSPLPLRHNPYGGCLRFQQMDLVKFFFFCLPEGVKSIILYSHRPLLSQKVSPFLFGKRLR